ncbi:MAG: putative transposase [Cyclobacteriaceae bacterium]|jgi:REP element-mobilizing transposase RayT
MEPETYYHIYNHANGDENLFRSSENYYFFLKQWAKYIEPVADAYCYCLMPNHFHFLVRTKGEAVVSENLGYSRDLPFGKFQTFQKVVSKQFSNLFSSYTQAFNKMYDRRGSLFMPNFKKKEITSDAYLTAVITYIHRNPIHHGFVNSIDDWSFSSYHAFLSANKTKLKREAVLEWYGNQHGFKSAHKSENTSLPDKSLLIDF